MAIFACGPDAADYQVKQYFLKTEYDPQFAVYKSDFREAWHKAQDLALFKWLPEIVTGLEHKHLNIDLDSEATLTRRLTI